MARSVQRGPEAEQLRGCQGEPHEAVGFLALGWNWFHWLSENVTRCATRTSVFTGTTLWGGGVPQYFLIGSVQISWVALEDSGGGPRHWLVMYLKCVVSGSICWKFSVNRVCPMDSFTLYFWHWWYPDYAMPCHLGVVFSVVSKLDRLMLFWKEFIGLVFRVNYRPKGHHPFELPHYNYDVNHNSFVSRCLYEFN